MITDDLRDENVDDAELAALSETRRTARDHWFRRFAASERRHHTADAWARRAEASRTLPRRGITPPLRSP